MALKQSEFLFQCLLICNSEGCRSNRPGVGVTKAPFVNLSVSKILDLSKVPLKLFESHLYLTGATAAELRRHLSNINVTGEIGLVTPTPGPSAIEHHNMWMIIGMYCIHPSAPPVWLWNYIILNMRFVGLDTHKWENTSFFLNKSVRHAPWHGNVFLITVPL